MLTVVLYSLLPLLPASHNCEDEYNSRGRSVEFARIYIFELDCRDFVYRMLGVGLQHASDLFAKTFVFIGEALISTSAADSTCETFTSPTASVSSNKQQAAEGRTRT